MTQETHNADAVEETNAEDVEAAGEVEAPNDADANAGAPPAPEHACGLDDRGAPTEAPPPDELPAHQRITTATKSGSYLTCNSCSETQAEPPTQWPRRPSIRRTATRLCLARKTDRTAARAPRAPPTCPHPQPTRFPVVLPRRAQTARVGCLVAESGMCDKGAPLTPAEIKKRASVAVPFTLGTHDVQ